MTLDELLTSADLRNACLAIAAAVWFAWLFRSQEV